jgi:transcriptional regulator with XRE-family HTH domain
MTLKDLRESKRLTQTELAAAVGVTAQAVYAWERGEYGPTFVNIRAMADTLGVEIKDVQAAIKETKQEKDTKNNPQQQQNS